MQRLWNSLHTSRRRIWQLFAQEESRSGIILVVTATVALVWANFASSTYSDFWVRTLNVAGNNMDLRHVVNEGLMVLFFLVVGIEVKRELIDGELRGWKRAAFPVIAAVGGMALPAIIFLLINPIEPYSKGWAIPMATDIAIVAGVLGLVARKIPRILRIFLLTLAIVDDIGSIILIALLFSAPTNYLGLVAALGLTIGLLLVRNQKHWLILFIIGSILLWYCLISSNIPGVLAGIIIALLMPLKTSRNNAPRLQASEAIEEILLPFTAYIVVPLFVLANAGLQLGGLHLSNISEFRVFIAVLLGLFIGKPLGIWLAVAIGKKLRIIIIPDHVTKRHILGVGCIAGIGFTVAIFISELAYASHPVLDRAAVSGIFAASTLSALIGFTILSKKRSQTINTQRID